MRPTSLDAWAKISPRPELIQDLVDTRTDGVSIRPGWSRVDRVLDDMLCFFACEPQIVGDLSIVEAVRQLAVTPLGNLTWR